MMKKTKEEKKAAMIEEYLAVLSTLKDCSIDINAASDNLGSQIAIFEEQIKKLNIGVSAWHDFALSEKTDRAIGYSRINGKWGFALRQTTKEPYSEEIWRFNEGPRWMRIESTPYLIPLLRTLAERAKEMTRLVKLRTEELEELLKEIE